MSLNYYLYVICQIYHPERITLIYYIGERTRNVRIGCNYCYYCIYVFVVVCLFFPLMAVYTIGVASFSSSLEYEQPSDGGSTRNSMALFHRSRT